MENTDFNKLLIFHINPSNDEITKELVLGKLSQAIKKASYNSHIAFLSHSNLLLLKKIILNIGLKEAYIISDSGARIFSIKQNEIIYEKSLPKHLCSAISHTGIIENCLVLTSGDTQEFSYCYNYLHQLALSKKHYIKLVCTTDFQKFSKFLESNNIYSIMIFNANYEKMFETYEKFTKVSSEWNFEIQRGIATYFTITNKDANNLTAIKYLMNYLKIPNSNNAYYYGLNVYDKDSLLMFKNRFVYQDVVLMSELKNRKYNFQLDINSLSHSIIKNSNPTN